MDLRLELVSVPVVDVDRAKAFYIDQVGFSVEQDVQVDESHRFVELMPPGSPCSIALTTGYIDSELAPYKESSSMSKMSMKCTHSYVIVMLKCPRSRTIPGAASASSPIPMATVGQSTARCVRVARRLLSSRLRRDELRVHGTRCPEANPDRAPSSSSTRRSAALGQRVPVASGCFG